MKIIKSKDSVKSRTITFIAAVAFLAIGIMMLVSAVTGNLQPTFYPSVGIGSFTPRLIEKFGWTAVASVCSIFCICISICGIFNSFFEIEKP